MIKDAMWITVDADFGEICPMFCKEIQADSGLKQAQITVTATGVYEAYINAKRVGDFIMAPGWTNYEKRLQYQTYDITKLLQTGKNHLEITVAGGWYEGKITREKAARIATTRNVIAVITLIYADRTETVQTDLSWTARKSRVQFSDIYDGEVYDANFDGSEVFPVKRAVNANKAVLIPQEGELVKEQETLLPKSAFKTPKGEWVIDFGQEMTGYIAFSVQAKKGEVVSLSFAEVMDKDGNFYNENYREALCQYKYICKDGLQSYKPHFTFYGFRYIRVDECPEGMKAEDFQAIVLHSDLQRTGWLKTKNEKVNRLFENIIWGQKGNFLDIPTDCPQRNERLGWTGDAQVFVKTACFQYNVEKFFKKWLRDMASEQRFDGHVPNVVPEVLFQPNVNANSTSAAWGDAAVICPWQLYEVFGNKEILKEFFPMMEGWISYMENTTCDKDLWTGHGGFGDWLGLDAGEGDYRGATGQDFVSSAYYKYSAGLVAKAAKILGLDSTAYESKVQRIRSAFIQQFPVFKTQTEHVLALYFDLTDKKAETAAALNQMILDNGTRLTTGFVGTPYLLFALSQNGYTDTAYKLLLQNKFPSWLYSVEKGATTIWEHWDGIKEDGTFWSKDMNSYNHYAYGSVAQWVFEEAAGIQITGEKLALAPKPNAELGDLEAEFHSRFGKVVSKWQYVDGKAKYEMEIPVECAVTIDGETKVLAAGSYVFE